MMPTRCQCAHARHGPDVCGADAAVTDWYSGIEIPLCAECYADGHMGDPDDDER